jgi:hypothetical protein
MRNRSIRYEIVWGLLGLVLALGPTIKLCQVRGQARKEVSASSVAESMRPAVVQPAVIWFHSVSSNSLTSLRQALSSQLINHVLMLYMHRNDADWRTNSDALAAIDLVKASKAKLIWCRDLWPYYKLKDVRAEDLFDPNYYVTEVTHLRAEAQEIGADLVALDTEPYGDSPLKRYVKNREAFTQGNFRTLTRTMEVALQRLDKVDYILPAGSTTRLHPYNLLSRLGVNRISETTYYNRSDRVARIRYPFEIYGAYVRPDRRNPEHASLPFYLVTDVFEQSQIWSHKKGVMLYTDGKHCEKTAQALNQYGQFVLQHRRLPAESPE